ncbi:MAG: hypothetical protein ABIS20_10735 [Thermoanaerobaculia bacterium]
MSSQKLPLHQRIAIITFLILAGIVAFGGVLGGFSYAYEFFSKPTTTYWGTVIIVLFWLFVKISRLRWVAKNGETTTVRGLGRAYTWGLVGFLVLLWIPRIFPPKPTTDNHVWEQKGEISASQLKEAQEAFSEGIADLKSYDLLNAKLHFCRAKQIDPRFLRARLNLARTWRARGYDGAAANEAQAILSMAMQMKANQSELKLYEAFRAETEGRWEVAVNNYRWLWNQEDIRAFDVLAFVEALNLAGESRRALKTIDEIRAKVKLLPLDEARLEIQRAIALMKSGSSEEERAAVQEAERLARDAKAQDPELDNSYLLARVRFFQCNALSSMQVCREALDGFRRQGDSVDVGKVYQVMGRIATDRKKGLSYYQKALGIYSAAGFQRGISDVLVEIAILLSDTHRMSQAAEVCGAARKTAEQIASLNLPEIRLSCTYYAKIIDKDFEGAQTEASEVVALTRHQDRGNRRLEAVALHDEAYAAHAKTHAQGNRSENLELYEEVLELYRAAIAIEEELQDSSWDARQTIFLYARLLSDLGRNTEARKELERALRPDSREKRRQKVEDVVCWDRKILGLGPAEWLRMLKRMADFTPAQCDTSEEEVTPGLNFDSSPLTKVNIEAPHC